MTWHSSWLSDTIVTYKLGSESGCGVIHGTVSVSMSELPGRSPSDGARLGEGRPWRAGPKPSSSRYVTGSFSFLSSVPFSLISPIPS